MFVQCSGNREHSLQVATIPWAPWDPDNGSWYLKTTSSLCLPPPVYVPRGGSKGVGPSVQLSSSQMRDTSEAGHPCLDQ